MKKVFLAVPVGNGTLTYDCHESIIRNTHYLRDKGFEIVPYYHPCHIYIDRGRNLCVKKFLATDCPDMVFIDSDVGFDDDGIWKLFKHDKDIVAGAYPFRKESKETDFPVVIDFSHENNCKEEETGLVHAKMAPTGLMRINRRVFEKMLLGTPDYVYSIEKDSEDVWNFFRTGILFKDDNTWYGEDVAFCMWWKAMGGAIYVEPDINFTHTGMKQFQGNFHQYLMGRSITEWQGTLDKNSDGLAGWMDENELFLLKELAGKSESIVEVGSWKGRSTKALLESCPGTVFAVDHWKGSRSDFSTYAAMGHDVYQEFINNVGHYSNLRVLRGDSVDMAQRFNGNKVDMVFIDADHSYESCKADIEAWTPKAKKFICGHDYGPGFPGVIMAVNEKFSNVKLNGSLWWVEL